MRWRSSVQVVLVAVLTVLEQSVCQFVPDSPCPNVFTYQRDDGSRRYYGLI
ncbi:hypothetical protein L9F63_025706, partial [Diploptera punctata]